jgi:hypothetical protein
MKAVARFTAAGIVAGGIGAHPEQPVPGRDQPVHESAIPPEYREVDAELRMGSNSAAQGKCQALVLIVLEYGDASRPGGCQEVVNNVELSAVNSATLWKDVGGFGLELQEEQVEGPRVSDRKRPA